MRLLRLIAWLGVLCCVFWDGYGGQSELAPGVRIASYNLRNYLSMDRVVDGRFRRNYPKPEEEKDVLRQTILAARPDLLVVQEIGGLDYLIELKRDLAGAGLAYGHVYLLEADDSTRMIGALWLPSLTVEPVAHLDLSFPLHGSRRNVKRGMLELKVNLPDGGGLSVFALHLKSRYTVDKRDFKAVSQRTGEAQAARERILSLHKRPRESNYLVLGDLNDYRNSSTLRRLLKRGDTVISEIVELKDERGLVWTHFYEKGGEYSLIDYALASPGLLKERSVSGEVLEREDFFTGSDHRLIWVDVSLPSGESRVAP